MQAMVRDLGFDVNVVSQDAANTPLHFAARRSDAAIMARLLRLHADPTKRDINGK